MSKKCRFDRKHKPQCRRRALFFEQMEARLTLSATADAATFTFQPLNGWEGGTITLNQSQDFVRGNSDLVNLSGEARFFLGDLLDADSMPTTFKSAIGMGNGQGSKLTPAGRFYENLVAIDPPGIDGFPQPEGGAIELTRIHPPSSAVPSVSEPLPLAQTESAVKGTDFEQAQDRDEDLPAEISALKSRDMAFEVASVELEHHEAGSRGTLPSLRGNQLLRVAYRPAEQSSGPSDYGAHSVDATGDSQPTPPETQGEVARDQTDEPQTDPAYDLPGEEKAAPTTGASKAESKDRSAQEEQSASIVAMDQALAGWAASRRIPPDGITKEDSAADTFIQRKWSIVAGVALLAAGGYVAMTGLSIVDIETVQQPPRREKFPRR